MRTIKGILRDHYKYRKQIFKLAKVDIDKTYKGSALGWLWAIIRPSITVFVFWFAIALGFRRGGDIYGYPFFLWLIAGMCPWFYMRDMLTGGAGCMRRYKHLVTKMKFPIATIPTFISMGKLVVHLIMLAIVVAIFMIAGYMPDIYYIQLFFYMALMFILFDAWALFAGMLSSISKDFLNMVKSITQALFWLSGIIYDVDGISDKHEWVKIVLKLNPINYIATGYRNCLVTKEWFWEDGIENVYFLVALALFMLLAVWSYNRLRKDIPDVL